MAKAGKRVMEGPRDNGQTLWLVWCPACNTNHPYDSGRWTFNGDYVNPTFTPSMLVKLYQMSPEGEAMLDRGETLPPGVDRYPGKDIVCHSYVTDGKMQYLDDCTHDLAGQTIELEVIG